MEKRSYGLVKHGTNGVLRAAVSILCVLRYQAATRRHKFNGTTN